LSERIEQYFTIKDTAYGEYREKGSKFFAWAHPASEEEEVKEHLERYRKDHPKACHWCYAYRLDLEGKQFRANDDGEPSGTAGKPILGQIDSKKLTKVFVVVVRYYGGKKLGASGLINAYKTSAAEALAAAEIIKIKIRSYHQVTFTYERMNDVMRFLKHDEMKIESQNYLEICKLTFSIPLEYEQQLLNNLSKLYDIEVEELDGVNGEPVNG